MGLLIDEIFMFNSFVVFMRPKVSDCWGQGTWLRARQSSMAKEFLPRMFKF